MPPLWSASELALVYQYFVWKKGLLHPLKCLSWQWVIYFQNYSRFFLLNFSSLNHILKAKVNLVIVTAKNLSSRLQSQLTKKPIHLIHHITNIFTDEAFRHQRTNWTIKFQKSKHTFKSSSILTICAWIPSTISLSGDIVGYFASSHTNLHQSSNIYKIQLLEHCTIEHT